MGKLGVKLKDMNVLGTLCLVTHPNLFTLQEHETTKSILLNIQYNDQNECKFEKS